MVGRNLSTNDTSGEKPSRKVRTLNTRIYYNGPLNDVPLTLKTVPLAVRGCIMHDGAPAHSSRLVRDALFNTFYRWIHTAEPVAWPHVRWTSDFYLGTLKNPNVSTSN